MLQQAVPLVRDTPQIRLFGNLQWTNVIPAGSQSFSPEEQATLAASFQGWYPTNNPNPKPVPAELDALRVLNPNMHFHAYHNSTATAANIANIQECEGDRLNIIQHYKEGVLETGINNSPATTTVRVTSLGTNGIKPSAAGSGDVTNSQADYVTWIAIVAPGQPLSSGEVCKVLSVTGTAPVILTVERGLGVTSPQTWAVGSLICCPIYQADNWPGSPNPIGSSLRYSLIPDSPQVLATSFFRPRLANFLNVAKMDGFMFDLLSSSFSEMRNAFGIQVTPWNFSANTLLTELQRLAQRITQMEMIKAAMAIDAPTRPCRIMGNNINTDFETIDGDGRQLFTSGAVEFMQFEGFAAQPSGGFFSISNWRKNLRDAAEMMQQNYGTIVSCKPNSTYDLVPQERDAYNARQFYDYVAIGLIFEPSNPKAHASFNFLVNPGANPFGPGNWVFNIPEWWYYDIGTPLPGDHATGTDHAADNTNALDPLIVAGTNSYDRQWLRAFFAQNPTTTPDTVPVPMPAGRHWASFSGGAEVTSKTLPANTGDAFWCWDFSIASDAPAGTNIGTVVGTHGAGAPYSYAIQGPTESFTIHSVSGIVSNLEVIEFVQRARYVIPIRITDKDGVSIVTERLVITTPPVGVGSNPQTRVRYP